MKTTVVLAAAALALSSGAALAAGNPAVANQTTTSMGAPPGSPGYQAPRSEAVPGLPAQARHAQEMNEATRQTDQSATAPVQGPKTLTGNTQTSR